MWMGVDVEIEGWTEEGTDFRRKETSLLFQGLVFVAPEIKINQKTHF